MHKSLAVILLAALFLDGSVAKSIGEELLTGFEAALNTEFPEDNSESCHCSVSSCECCSKLGPSKVCNAIKLVGEDSKQDFALELSVDIDKNNIFSEKVFLKELAPLCHPYGDFNYCVQVGLSKNKQDGGKLCGNFLAKPRESSTNETRTLLRTEIFCLQFETHQVMDLLRFVSQF